MNVGGCVVVVFVEIFFVGCLKVIHGGFGGERGKSVRALVIINQ